MKFVQFLVISWLFFPINPTKGQEPIAKRAVIRIEHADVMEGAERFGKNYYLWVKLKHYGTEILRKTLATCI